MQFPKLPAVFLSLVLSACGGSSGSATSSTMPAKTGANAGDPSCPVAVAGTSVTVEDTADGASLVFVTTGDVADVRRRTAAMSSMHNDHHGSMGPLPDGADVGSGHAGHDMSGHAGHDMSKGHAGHDTRKGGAPAGGMIGVHSKATASDVEAGAKLTFVVNAADVAKLQSELRLHAQHLGSGKCAMGMS